MHTQHSLHIITGSTYSIDDGVKAFGHGLSGTLYDL
jgi:hypothetical protein